jgi:DNA-binding response OmpR family regulator
LLIDDDRDNVAICSVFLAHFGFHVIVAADVATGVLLARDSRPAVVITELFARTGTGWSVLEALRAARDGRHPRDRPEHPRAPRRS